jgi:D-alanyl-lipoteichoic acid acyltransferase DltB (MBOAT superfamily)
LYISLGGSRVSIPRWYLNLFIVFLVSGLWHGANWTFIIWGGLNGFYLVFAIITKKLRAKFVKITGLVKLSGFNQFLQIITTFVLVCFAWIFFRANNVNDAFNIIYKIFSFKGSIYVENPGMLIYSFFGILILILIEMKQEYYKGLFLFMNNKNWLIRYISYATIIILILLIGVFDGGQFIYFQF